MLSDLELPDIDGAQKQPVTAQTWSGAAWPLLVALLSVLASAQHAQAVVDPTRLGAIKAASAFISVTTRADASSGSGFVIHKADQRALVATNAHVVRHASDDEIDVVLNSGTRDVRVLSARVLVQDLASDLAILEIKGKALPAPVPLARSDDVTETLELYIVGFPFGQAFATNRDTPAVTVGTGTVSSLRLDRNEQIQLLQIDGDINRGNSGGPVISEDGAVIGVSVYTVAETNIGFAVPVRKLNDLLSGVVGNLRVLRASKQVNLIGDWLDPFDRPFAGRALFGPVPETQLIDPDRSGRWPAISGKVKSASFVSKPDGRVFAALPLSVDTLATWHVQIAITLDGVERYQAPIQLTSGPLVAGIEGPNALPEDEPREVLADLERSDAEQADAAVVEALIDASGLDEFIDKIATDRALLFGRESKSAPAESNEEKDVKARLIEILARSWDKNRVQRHYVDTFLGAFRREAARSMLALLKLQAARDLHVDFITLTTKNEEGFDAAIEELSKDDDRINSRLALFERIDRARGLSSTINTAIYTPQLTIRRVINELVPAGRRMSLAQLERELALENRSERPRLERVVKILLTQHYRGRSNEEIAHYAELVETDAFRWFSERESEAYSAMITLRFSAAESEVRDVFREIQKNALDVAQVQTQANMTPEAVVQSVLDAYGFELVFKYLMSKSSDGSVAIETRGKLRFQNGRPPKALVTPRAILVDLERFGIDLEQFTQELENRAIAAGIRDRQLQMDGRRFH